jgi:hypothetical protein
MSKIALLVLLLVAAVSLVPVSAGSRRPTDVWNYYHFNGTTFLPGPGEEGGVMVAVREKLQPLFMTAYGTDISSTPLPDGSGAFAGLCFSQSYGGKLGVHSSGYDLLSHLPLQITGAGINPVTLQTDEHGYFMAVLPAGSYSVRVGQIIADITVERGVTKLMPLRIGKKMVD